ncbi:phosphotransferase family protein [Heyndrickxia sporothermodurans]
MFKELFQFISGKRETIKQFRKNTKYMSSGEYRFDESIEYICRSDCHSLLRASEMFQKNLYKKVFAKLIIFLLRKVLFNKKLNVIEHKLSLDDFSGTIFIPVRSTSGYIDIRIFDLTRNKVLTVFSRKKDYNSVIENYGKFKPFFHIPTVLWKSDEDLLIIEELIIFQPKTNWGNDDYLLIMKVTFELYLTFFKNKQEKIHSFITPQNLFQSLPGEVEIKDLWMKISKEITNMKLPYTLLHGDLWTSNILYKKSDDFDVYFIDWEYSSEFIFFYDLFNMMWLEVYMNNNYVYVEKYVNGDYDLYFYNMFAIFDLKFQSKYKQDYFIIYFLEFMKNRLSYFDTNNVLFIIPHFMKFLDTMKQMVLRIEHKREKIQEII